VFHNTATVAHRESAVQGILQPETTARNGGRANGRDDRVDISHPASHSPQELTFVAALVSLVGASGIALLIPLVILLIGLPIALAIRGVVEAVSWLIALIAA
jgi:hypothetical protein